MTAARAAGTRSSARSGDQPLLLGEWACLGILLSAPAHGFAIAARLKPDGDIGRVWSMSRALTYRALDQLSARGLVRVVGEEPGLAGGNRTILGVTPRGRARLRRWLQAPVAHLRDLRSELLLKLVIAEQSGVDVRPMLTVQRQLVQRNFEALADQAAQQPGDVVALWRLESSRAALRFLDHVIDPVAAS